MQSPVVFRFEFTLYARWSRSLRLLNKESVYSRLSSVSNALYLDENLDYDNRVFEMIDSITREDIDKMSQKAFAEPPVYSIVASQDTLDYNKDFLASLSL